MQNKNGLKFALVNKPGEFHLQKVSIITTKENGNVLVRVLSCDRLEFFEKEELVILPEGSETVLYNVKGVASAEAAKAKLIFEKYGTEINRTATLEITETITYQIPAKQFLNNGKN